MVKKIIQGNVLSENKVIVNNSTLKGTLVQQGFGENKVNKLKNQSDIIFKNI